MITRFELCGLVRYFYRVNNTGQRQVGNILKQACLLLLLALYSVAALRVNSFHEFFHAKEVAELHSIEHENNPCHKRIYHQQSKTGCEHKSHVTENTKCPLCEFNVTPDQLIANLPAQSKVTIAKSNQLSGLDAILASHQICLSSRGPPANV